MKNFALLLIISGCFYFSSCKKVSHSEPFDFLTGPVWTTDSLLANGVDASGDPVIGKFKGDAKFYEDGTGYFGIYTGIWRFAYNETQIVITTDSLDLPLTTKIAELTKTSLKITTTIPNAANPAATTNIRMTFKAK